MRSLSPAARPNRALMTTEANTATTMSAVSLHGGTHAEEPQIRKATRRTRRGAPAGDAPGDEPGGGGQFSSAGGEEHEVDGAYEHLTMALLMWPKK